ncbi:NIPSNAP family protein [Dokdonella sp. MW10]|uniref:NIPSNAP family protein n=1 Tax=Dokdonella sp. MW10 TaxID=2992926 RepID=UPI003F7D4EB4
MAMAMAWPSQGAAVETTHGAATKHGDACCTVVELRRYTLHPFKRDVLIDLFERVFVEPQEALGIRVLGTFRDLDAPDRFVWLRGFTDMPARTQALEAFYGGEVWRTHRQAANRTMIDSDDVFLLRPVWQAEGFAAEAALRAVDSVAVPEGFVVAQIRFLPADGFDARVQAFVDDAVPMLRQRGVDVLAVLATEPSPNGYPRLPVREGEHAVVWLVQVKDMKAFARHEAALAADAAWSRLEAALARHATAPPQTLRLQPTPRSRLPRGI